MLGVKINQKKTCRSQNIDGQLAVFPSLCNEIRQFYTTNFTTRRYEYDDEELQAAGSRPPNGLRMGICHVLIHDLENSRRILQRLSTGIMSIECPKKAVRFS